MTLDELTRALHEQADEAMASSPDFVRTLPPRRSRDRRRLLVVAVAPLAVAVVVLLALVVRPGPDEVRRPAGPAASPSPIPSAIDGWPTVACEHTDIERVCAPPAILRYDGRQWQSTQGGRQPVHNPSGTDLVLSMSPAGSRLLVVGTLRGGPGSRLVVRIGDGPALRLPSTGLNVVPLPAHAGDVVVAERGEPGPEETLALETYVPLP